jgi:hypothetical protein
MTCFCKSFPQICHIQGALVLLSSVYLEFPGNMTLGWWADACRNRVGGHPLVKQPSYQHEETPALSPGLLNSLDLQIFWIKNQLK